LGAKECTTNYCNKGHNTKEGEWKKEENGMCRRTAGPSARERVYSVSVQKSQRAA
jgi:hypothetical protein